MAKEWITDWQGWKLGSVETDAKGNKVYRDFSGKITGKYNVNENLTRDFYGKVLTKGDTGVSTLSCWNEKK